jgi:hypothetical protein
VEAVRDELGVVVRGSLSEGLEMRLAEGKSVEDLRVGKFVVVQGEKSRFFALLNDVQLSATNPGVLLNPPRPEETLSRAVLAGTSTFGTVKLRPMLMVPREADSDDPDSLQPVKTVPAHFSPVYEATRDDVGRVFGDERRGPHFFHVGTPLDMDTPVCLNLDRWVERSNAIFGKSGTGKTFLTRLCLCGVIRADKAVNLIFDMHSEYGWQGTTEDRNRASVRGLKQYFNNRVQIFTLDPESSKRRGVRPDFEVRIPYSAVTVDDILLLQRELNLNATAVESCYMLMRRLGAKWFETFLDMEVEDVKEFVAVNNAHPGALSALQRKLQSLVEQCRDFLVPVVPGDDDAVQHILETLQNGRNVVLEFGQHDRPVQYMLVANILTRRLHQIYTELTERAMGSEGAKPRPLVITIEEAHKFLSSHLADQTIFGTIAREMRKYNVTLLIVDQRPSGIDDEVLSQVGTKICCLLDDEKDMEAVLMGVSGANSLRSVLASLETKQQALLFGHAVPMPVVVRTRPYDDEPFRLAMAGGDRALPDGAPEAVAARRERVLRDRDRDFA